MPAATIDDYLASVPDHDQREALQLLRDQIQAAAPDATEAISYGRPAFKVGGRWLVGFSATTKHCSFYAGAAPIQANSAELAGYQLGKGTISFPPDRPLPPELVAELVRDARSSRAC
jgi:uncharacterized protein YdhG (YjbR/CyaY superfamily)